MKWQQYKEYKDSDIEWLGEMPKHWEVTPLRGVLKQRGEYNIGPRTENILSVVKDVGVIRYEERDASGNKKSDNIEQYKIIHKGDIVLNRMNIIIGSVGMAKEFGAASIEYYVLYSKDSSVYTEYYVYIFTSKLFQTNLGRLGSGILGHRLRIPYEILRKEMLCKPPPSEQKTIAAFLDRETSRIDKLIEKKEKQIELLKEKRAALISHAVTKGLDPKVKMKDSGIEWLGEIPESWEVRKLKHIASVKFSNVDKKITEGQQPVRLCNYVDVYYNDFITSDLNLMNASASTEEIVRFSLKEGDVLITKDSESWDDIAVPAYVSLDLAGVVCGYHLAQVRPKTALVDGKYLFRSFCFQGINYQYRVEATGITRYGLGKYWLDNSLFLLPPMEEQQAISTFLDRETGRIDSLVKKVQKSIETLKEYRTALISAAVTGKIDVRGTV